MENDGQWMHTVQMVIKGAGIVLFGNFSALLATFLSRIMVARNYSQEEYGIYSISVVVLTIITILSTLGLYDGVARQISYYLGKNDAKKVQKLIINSIVICILSSILFVFIMNLFFSFTEIDPKILKSVRTLLYCVPFFSIIYVLSAIFRAFGEIKEKVIFMDLMRNLLFLAILLYIISKGQSFDWVIKGLAISVIITSLLFITRLRRLKINFHLTPPLMFDISTIKNLLKFSLPLLFVSILYYLLNWNSTLFLWYFGNAEMVGVYNAAFSISLLLSMILASLSFAYLPLFSKLIATQNFFELRTSYKMLSKWLCIFSLPTSVIFFLFPDVVINFFFGIKYISAQEVLPILAIGFLFNLLMGPAEVALIGTGETKYLMKVTLLSVIINTILCIIFIPVFGIKGGAIATAASIIFLSFARMKKTYTLYKLHPFERFTLKLYLIFFMLLLISKLFQIKCYVRNYQMPIFLISWGILYPLLLFYTKIINKTDLQFITYTMKNLGIKFNYLTKCLKKLKIK